MGLQAWASLVLVGDFDSALNEAPIDSSEPASVAIHNIAARLTGNISGIEADLARKSLEEALYLTVGTNEELKTREMMARLLGSLRRAGSARFIKRFLSLHVFNIVWFLTSDSFRGAARTQESFLQDMNGVEDFCRSLVSTIWSSSGLSVPFDSSSALELVKRIENRLLMKS